MSGCKECIHYGDCGYFNLYDNKLTEEENFIEHCVGCCECNQSQNNGCLNWEDGSEPILGQFKRRNLNNESAY